MSNTIKYSEGSESLALNKGNWWIGTGDSNKGPSDVTGYYAGVTPPPSGYTIYTKREDNLPSIFVAQNDQELINLTNLITESNFSTVQQCFNYYQTQDDMVCLNREIENIVTDGLVLNLDASYVSSYPKSGNTWYDLSGNGNNGSLVNGPTFDGSNEGSLVFDGADDYVNYSEITFTNTEFTTEALINLPGPIDLSNRRIVFGGYSWELSSTSVILMRFIANGISTFINIYIGMNITLGVPFLIHLIKESGNIYKVYINGEIKSTVIPPYISYPDIEITSDTIIEHRYNRLGNTFRRFNGNFYYARIYNRALTPKEVLQNYNAQKGRFGL